MRYELTDDAGYVTRCLTEPAVWRMSSDDAFSRINPKLLFIKKNNDLWLKTPHGVLIGKPVNSITYDCHIALLPEACGIAVDICKGAIQWIFRNTKCLRLIASVPEYNKLAIRLARESGMEFMGINKKSFLKEGRLFDQQLFGISKEDLKLLHKPN